MKLMLGRPLAFSMTAVVVLLFLWNRSARQSPMATRSVRVWAVGCPSTSPFTPRPSISGSRIALPPPAVCLRVRSALIFLPHGWPPISPAAAAFGWYNTVEAPLVTLRARHARRRDKLGAPGRRIAAFRWPGHSVAGCRACRHGRSFPWHVLSQRNQAGRSRPWWSGRGFWDSVSARFYGEWALPRMAVGSPGSARCPEHQASGLPRASAASPHCRARRRALLRPDGERARRYHAPYDNCWLTTPSPGWSARCPTQGASSIRPATRSSTRSYHRFPRRRSGTRRPSPPESCRPRIARSWPDVGVRPLQFAKPWVDRMTPQDRIVITTGRPSPTGLEWISSCGSEATGLAGRSGNPNRAAARTAIGSARGACAAVWRS